VTQTWLFQLNKSVNPHLPLFLPRVVEPWSLIFPSVEQSIIVQVAAEQAAINQSQDLSDIRVGLHDEIFQGEQPVLVGVDARSTYCYLLAG